MRAVERLGQFLSPRGGRQPPRATGRSTVQIVKSRARQIARFLYLAHTIPRNEPSRPRRGRDVRRVHGRRLAGVAQGARRHRRRPDRRRPLDAAVDRRAHDDRDLGRRRLPARHHRRRLQVVDSARHPGRPVLRHQPDPRRPVLRRHHAPHRLHDADRSVRSALRQALGGRAVPAGARRRAVLERGAARRHRLDVRRRCSACR